MIDIVRFREVLLEIAQRVNTRADKYHIEGIVMAVREGHMQKKLRDKEGIWLCANYPDSELRGSEDSHLEKNQILLFLIEKVPSGRDNDEDELQNYARMQRLTKLLKEELLSGESFCGYFQAEDGMTTEWEFDTFGGWNGLSIGVKVTDYD